MGLTARLRAVLRLSSRDFRRNLLDTQLTPVAEFKSSIVRTVLETQYNVPSAKLRKVDADVLPPRTVVIDHLRANHAPIHKDAQLPVSLLMRGDIERELRLGVGRQIDSTFQCGAGARISRLCHEHVMAAGKF